MNTFFLERFSNHPNMGVFGTLITPTTIYNTVEQPWNDNQPFKSCVPDGIYTLKAFNSPRWGQTFALVGETVAITEAEVRVSDTLKRYACLFHTANRSQELAGCIAPGMDLGSIASVWAVTSSAQAMLNLMHEMHDGDQLIITWKKQS